MARVCASQYYCHYVILLSIKDPDERGFCEIEAAKQGWSVPELTRQKASALYERLKLLAAGKSLYTKILDHVIHGRVIPYRARKAV